MRPPLIPQSVPINEDDPNHVKILKQLYNHLIEYREPDTGRIIVAIFMCLPSRKDFPEYFDIIQRPISMYEIRKRIENGVYKTEDPCLEDFKLMFKNCRTFNEDGSIIYGDAVKLEDMLMKKYEQLISSFKITATANHNNHIDTNNKPKLNGSPIKIRKKEPELPKKEPEPPKKEREPETPVKRDPEPPKKEVEVSSKRDPDAPKKRLLTGYIVYAAEVRKEYVDKHPNQDFGYISRLIGNDWKALSRDLKLKYDQRAKIHNKKMLEKSRLENRAAATTAATASSTAEVTITSKSKTSESHITHHGNHEQNGRSIKVDSATQTAKFRFVEPPAKRRHTYAETYRRYIESLNVPNTDLLAEETSCPDRPPEPVSTWLGAGIGRHESTDAALWALRDFMLQNSETMRMNMQPYLCYLD